MFQFDIFVLCSSLNCICYDFCKALIYLGSLHLITLRSCTSIRDHLESHGLATAGLLILCLQQFILCCTVDFGPSRPIYYLYLLTEQTSAYFYSRLQRQANEDRMPSHAAPAGSSLYCSSCSSAVERCHPRSRPKASAETEAEKWFYRSPFCSQHSHDIVVMYQGKSMGLEELWKRKWQEVAPRSRSSYRPGDGHGGRELHRDWDHRSRSKD